jgi:VacB/RNase II family 3'-5' exoribonuclease
MTHNGFDLVAAARQEMRDRGFEPDFPPEIEAQVASLHQQPVAQTGSEVRDLRALLWSSIDNDTSRDLDQIEYAERRPSGIRVLIGIADVSADVAAGSPIDRYAASETTSVYTGVCTFPMLPEQLSTNLTSLLEGAERLAMVIEFMVAEDGTITSSSVYRGLVRNRAQLTYSAVGPWLEAASATPPKLAASLDLQEQLKLQDEAAVSLRGRRHRLGALNFDRMETHTVVAGGKVQGIAALPKNRAGALIEDFMVAANEVMARMLREAGVSSIRRVVRSPRRWPRIVELAANYGEKLPAEPDPAALNEFLQRRKAADPARYEDLSLSVIKLLGPGEYVLARQGDPAEGHFGLAALDYTHSTAPNRRFADLVTQRLVRAVITQSPAPYPDDQLGAIAENCTEKEDAARKVERAMAKRIAAVLLQDRIGDTFAAIVTGASVKGVYVRVLDPPVEGRLVRGERGVDVGDHVKVTLLSADPWRGFIDFVR